MFVRAVVAFLVLPRTVAFLVPLLLLRPDPPARVFHLVAVAPLTIGTFMLFWCVRDFYVAGKGTLAPWSPPRHLVVVGLYRWSRNPMYLAGCPILAGVAVLLGTTSPLLVLALYGVGASRWVAREEARLAERFGGEWTSYSGTVRRWL